MTLRRLLPHGVATIRELREAGVRDAEVRTALRRGELRRLREGVVALPDCPEPIVAAAGLGGRLAGASAARVHGLWTPPSSRLVVEVPRGAHVPPSGAVIVRGSPGRNRYGVSPLEDVVGQVLRTEPVPFAVAILDSLVRRSPISRVALEAAVESLPRRLRSLLTLVDERAESGTESVVRVLLALAGIRAVPQARVPFTELDRLDLVVGDRLVIECDSRAHHSTPADLDRDNARDLALTALGFLVLRVRYRVVMSDPDAIVAAVRRLVELGLHLDASAPSSRATPQPVL